MKLKGISVKNIRIKDGKIEPVTKFRSVSDRIRQKNSKRVRVAKSMGGT